MISSFLILPTPSTSSINISSTGALIAGILLLAPAYLISISVALLSKSWLFNLDILLIPCLCSGALGLINVIYTISIQKSVSWDLHLLLALALSVISLIAYGAAALLTFRKIYIVRMRDGMHRHQAPASASKFLPETELQRQQLLRLLLQQQEQPKANVSPQLGSEQTYKLDWPENQERNARRGTWNTMPGNPFSRSRRSSYNHAANGGGAAAGSAYPILGGAGETHQAPSGYAMGAADRGVPDIIVEEATLQDSVVPPLDHILYATPMTRQEAEDEQDGEEEDLADISGIVNTPYSQVTGAMTQPLPHLEPNGYPAEKPAVYNIPPNRRPDRPLNNYTVVDTADMARGSGHASNHDRNPDRESRRMEIELADRGQDGTGKSWQELGDVEVVGSIRRVETEGWGRRF